MGAFPAAIMCLIGTRVIMAETRSHVILILKVMVLTISCYNYVADDHYDAFEAWA